MFKFTKTHYKMEVELVHWSVINKVKSESFVLVANEKMKNKTFETLSERTYYELQKVTRKNTVKFEQNIASSQTR